MDDLTVIYLTANRIPETSALLVRKVLKRNIGKETKLISVTFKPIDFGYNICVGELEPSARNIYKQVLLGAKEARTPFIAIAEDNVFYSKKHFRLRPKADNDIIFDSCKWQIHTWRNPSLYSLPFHTTNSMMVAPRLLTIAVLEERFHRWPNPASCPTRYMAEVGRFQKRNHPSILVNLLHVWAKIPSIIMIHERSLGFKVQGKGKHKGWLQAYDIPYWGPASGLLKKWKVGWEAEKEL